MKIFSTALFIGLLLAVPNIAFSASEYTPKKDPAFLKGLLAANEKMLARFEARLGELAVAEADEKTSLEITQLTYKIEALHEDRARLESLLAEQEKAKAFADDLAAAFFPPPAQEEPQAPEAPAIVAPGERKVPELIPLPHKIDHDKAESLGLMHSNALDYVTQKKYPEALQIYNEIILLDPEDDQAYIIMGHIHMMMNNFEKAQASFKNAAHIDPDNIYEITPFYENMILQDANDDMAHTYLGYAYLILGELPRAEASFVDALNLNSQNMEARKGLQIVSRSAKGGE